MGYGVMSCNSPPSDLQTSHFKRWFDMRREKPPDVYLKQWRQNSVRQGLTELALYHPSDIWNFDG
jgi:hypothetical protein